MAMPRTARRTSQPASHVTAPMGVLTPVRWALGGREGRSREWFCVMGGGLRDACVFFWGGVVSGLDTLVGDWLYSFFWPAFYEAN